MFTQRLGVTRCTKCGREELYVIAANNDGLCRLCQTPETDDQRIKLFVKSVQEKFAAAKEDT